MNYTVINNPHLPTGKVLHMIVGNNIPDAMQYRLECEGIEVLKIKKLPKIEENISDHTDLAVCPVNSGKILLAPSQTELKEKLISLGICVIMNDKEPQTPYPSDCLLNNLYNCDISILNHFANVCSDCKKILRVKQGYVKCSIAPIAERAIMTDDPGIANAAKTHGMDVCFVEKGDVVLRGYPYGFIGGCCGKIDRQTIAFCGDLHLHKNYSDIKTFLRKHNVEFLNLLSNHPLTDIGSLIPITQMKG